MSASSNDDDDGGALKHFDDDDDDDDQQQQQQQQSFQTEFVAELRPTDVVFGRGKGFTFLPGNRAFRAIVWNYKRQFVSAKCNKEKTAIALEVIRKVAKLDPPGRFLEKCSSSSNDNCDEAARYTTASPGKIYAKTCQALREKKHREPDFMKMCHPGGGEAAASPVPLSKATHTPALVVAQEEDNKKHESKNSAGEKLRRKEKSSNNQKESSVSTPNRKRRKLRCVSNSTRHFSTSKPCSKKRKVDQSKEIEAGVKKAETDIAQLPFMKTVAAVEDTNVAANESDRCSTTTTPPEMMMKDRECNNKMTDSKQREEKGEATNRSSLCQSPFSMRIEEEIDFNLTDYHHVIGCFQPLLEPIQCDNNNKTVVVEDLLVDVQKEFRTLYGGSLLNHCTTMNAASRHSSSSVASRRLSFSRSLPSPPPTFCPITKTGCPPEVVETQFQPMLNTAICAAAALSSTLVTPSRLSLSRTAQSPTLSPIETNLEVDPQQFRPLSPCLMALVSVGADLAYTDVGFQDNTRVEDSSAARENGGDDDEKHPYSDLFEEEELPTVHFTDPHSCNAGETASALLSPRSAYSLRAPFVFGPSTSV